MKNPQIGNYLTKIQYEQEAYVNNAHKKKKKLWNIIKNMNFGLLTLEIKNEIMYINRG